MADRRHNSFESAPYGGEGWSPRLADHRDELGTIWSDHAVASEWRRLRAVLVHRPGGELAASLDDPGAAQMLAPVDAAKAAAEHDAMVAAYADAGVSVHRVEPAAAPSPNLMFCADLFVMTPAGAILARPASTVRAGEERWVARRLADLGVPIVHTFTGTATFEGADLMWLDASTALVARGPRTNQAGVEQVTAVLQAIECAALVVDLPYGSMHLMGLVRIIDEDLAIGWPRRTPHAAVMALRERGMQVEFPPFSDRPEDYRGVNFVTLGPRQILMPHESGEARGFYERLGVDCVTTPTEELSKAAGNTGCLTGVLSRAAS